MIFSARLFWTIAITAGVLLTLMCVGPMLAYRYIVCPDDGLPFPEDEPATLHMSVNKFCRRYSAKTMKSADVEPTSDQVIELTGNAVSSGPRPLNEAVTIDMNPPTYPFVIRGANSGALVSCRFSVRTVADLAPIHKGDTVTIRGHFQGSAPTKQRQWELTDCKLMPREPLAQALERPAVQ